MAEQTARLELVSTRLPGPIAARLREIAARDERSIAAVARRLLTRALEEMKAEAKTA